MIARPGAYSNVRDSVMCDARRVDVQVVNEAQGCVLYWRRMRRDSVRWSRDDVAWCSYPICRVYAGGEAPDPPPQPETMHFCRPITGVFLSTSYPKPHPFTCPTEYVRVYFRPRGLLLCVDFIGFDVAAGCVDV